MSAGRPSENLEGTTLSGYTLDVIEYLQECLDAHERGDNILADPFYIPKSGSLTDEQVDRVITALDEEFDKEIDGFPTYHERRSGANAKTDWHRLNASNRRALVEGLMRINEDWDAYQKAPPAPKIDDPSIERPIDRAAQRDPGYTG